MRGYCLFQALQATLVCQLRTYSKTKWHRYKHSKHGMAGKLEEDTLKLMDEVGVPRGRDGYYANEWVPRIAKLWNDRYESEGVKIRVFVFEETGHYKAPIKEGAVDFNLVIAIVHRKDHFDGVSNHSGLFGRKYCFTCEVPYRRDSEHNMNCRSMCHPCGGVGLEFPCPKEPGYSKRCDGCHKTFINRDCYDQHKKKHHTGTCYCDRSKKCLACGVIWNVKDNTRGDRKEVYFNQYYV